MRLANPHKILRTSATRKVGRIRFDETVTDVLNDYRTNRKRSLDDLERRIEKHLKPFFGNRRMASITTADIREYIASRQKETMVARKVYTFTARDGNCTACAGTAPHDSRRIVPERGDALANSGRSKSIQAYDEGCAATLSRRGRGRAPRPAGIE
jgi:Phage integrase, N-terminal SAM-like domain